MFHIASLFVAAGVMIATPLDKVSWPYALGTSPPPASVRDCTFPVANHPSRMCTLTDPAWPNTQGLLMLDREGRFSEATMMQEYSNEAAAGAGLARAVAFFDRLYGAERRCPPKQGFPSSPGTVNYCLKDGRTEVGRTPSVLAEMARSGPSITISVTKG